MGAAEKIRVMVKVLGCSLHRMYDVLSGKSFTVETGHSDHQSLNQGQLGR
jgi:hypothetical protein